MKNLKQLASMVDKSAPDRWYVTDGATAVGPVTLELLGRGIEAEKVPLDGFVRHESWTAWRRLSDLVEHAPVFDARKTFRTGRHVAITYAEAMASIAPPQPAPKPAPRPGKTPVPRPAKPAATLSEKAAAPRPGKGARPTPKRTPSAPDGLTVASDLPESLLMLLSTAARQCDADASLIHDVRDDGAIVVCSHGASMFEALGSRTPPSDPALVAAREGHTILVEPTPGPAGRVIRTRLSRGGRKVEGAFMVPIRPGGRLFAFLEVGRAKPFRAKDVAAVEALVDAVVREAETEGWGIEWLAAEDIEPVG
jgi:hypothetical protein